MMLLLPDNLGDGLIRPGSLLRLIELQLYGRARGNFIIQEQAVTVLADILGISLPFHRDEQLIGELGHVV